MRRFAFLSIAAVSTALLGTRDSRAEEPSAFHIQAHRGAGIAMPENTLESARWAWQLGVTPECDLRMSKDKQIVCFHDANFARVPSNVDADMKKLGVEKLSLAELQKLDVGSFRGSKYAGERIPTLESIFAEMHGHPEKMVYLDIKTVDMDQLAELIHKHGLERQSIFTSKHHKLLKEWKQRIPESPTLIWNGGTEAELTEKMQALRNEGFKDITHLQIHVHVKDLASDQPFDPPSEWLQTLGKELKSRGIVFQVLPWECSEQRAYEKLLAIGAESFATDYPEVTLAAAKAFREQQK